MQFTIRALGEEDAAQYYSLINEIKDEGKYLFASFRIPLENIKNMLCIMQR